MLRRWGFASAVFSHLRGGAWAFGNSGYIGTCLQRYQIAGRRVSGFSRSQNPARSPQVFEFVVQFSVAHNGGGISPGRLDQCFESQSGTVFSRVPSPVHRPDVKQQNRSISRVGSYIRHNRNNLVPYLSVVRLVPERALAHERNDRAMAQSNCRRALCFSRSPSRHGEVTISILPGDSLRSRRSFFCA